MSNNKFIVWCMIACFTYSLPILSSPVLYGDDMGRALLGYSLWGGIGRPLADYVMNILSFGTQMVDMSPLPQMLGVACVALTAAMLCNKTGISNNVNAIVTSILIIGNPFFLANLSFKFDALPMCFSLLLAYSAVHVIDHKIYRIFSPVLVVAFLSLYQASLPVFMVSTVIFVVYMVTTKVESKRIGYFILMSVSSLIIGYLIYSIFIASVFLTDPYSIKHSGITLDVQKVVSNAVLYGELIWQMMLGWQAIAFIILGISALVSASLLAYRYYSGSSRSVACICISMMIIASPFISVILSVLPLLFLENPVVTPRVFIGMSMAMASWYVLVVLSTKSRFSWVIAAPLCLFMFVFCYTFSNANKQQFEFEKEIASKIGDDVSEMDDSSSLDQIVFFGREPMSPLLRSAYKKFPVMYAFVPQHMNTTSWVGYITLRHNAFTERLAWHKGKIQQEFVDSMECKDRVVYCIGLANKVVVVRFK
ncbi:glucosyltransferase domain-containing protein [Enterobacter cloacae]|uniref:glucosyltransferase domain-containing protein n=1 Tax=Enterobacter cloacae TaxID=550 RepID=UPI000C9A8DC3|nr:glucosyltransferase domain-containing protein [Enterobacter cloacae]NBC61503.1 hypothetical protein [Enterobacter cloacae]PNC33553.1 hypothetical protein CK475_07100 [Enterobacter cloacae]HEI8775491.1 glucosyltransferase domain-containing protein [Enterobacter cloacae]